MRKIIDKICNEAKAHFSGARRSHGWDHTGRVRALAMHIGKVECADLNILELAALLHDIGRHKEDESLGEVCHAVEGAKMARTILARYKLETETIDRVVHAIARHRYRGKAKPETLEARILYDADKLDAIGAVGIGRAFLFAGEQGAKLHNAPGVDPLKHRAYGPEDTAYREFLAKLRYIHRKMLTAEGRRLAKRRHTFMLRFFRELAAETGGSR